ncbi:hypothetical protein HDF16_003880 [Granulicella aggregans]|uniref:TonB-dependent transporter Oar-like beta-barrel domain-containing protein n=1 Tax=Granulicella aggregans TaxID=474949 RepID=A0A7W7ZG02_9BACT|nr:hypothetical protein [Granulicella aggregans]
MNRKIRRYLSLPVVLLLAFVVSLTCSAQQNSEINGIVTDKQGAVVPNAHLILTLPSTGLTRETDSNTSGFFTFPGLNIGTYTLKVTAPGFQTSLQSGLELNISQTLRSDISMIVGSVDTTVSVEASALQVQADSNVVSTLINSEQFSEIATENRNFAALVALGLGVSTTLPDSNTPTSVASNFNISVNGLRESHNIWLIDGGEADDRGGGGGPNIMPSQDAISQLETLSSNYPPDYGISSGATISLGLKSGTRKFHGSIWEFNRNADYDANTYFNKQGGQARTKLNYNIYGFNIGGPLFVPKTYNTGKEKTFFFWNEEWRKIVQGSTPNAVNTLPAADFPVAGQNLAYVAPAFAPTTSIIVPTVGDAAYNAKLATLGLVAGQPFPNQTIPAALLDPNAILYLASGIVPKPNLANGQNVSSANQPIYVRDDVVRIDHKLNDKFQILGHYLADKVIQGYASPMLGWSGASYPTITSTLTNPSNSAVVKLTDTISPNLLAEASFNYDGNVIGITNSANSQNPSGWTVSPFFANGSKNVPNMNWGSPYGTQENPGSAPWHNAARDYSPNGSLYYAVGKHQMKFGLGYNRYTKNQQLFGDPGGQFKYGTLSNDSFVDMILGLASTYDQAQALNTNHYVNQTTSAYVMDNWHVTPTLSLQLGLRYDALPHAYERANQIANFDPTQYLQSSAAQFNADGTLNASGPGFQTVGGTAFYQNGIYNAGTNGYPKGLVTNDYATLQPRVGFSDDIFGHGKTILRGGFGSFYERVQGNDIYNTAANEPYFNDPQASSVYLSNPHTSFATGNTAALPNFAQGLTSLARTYKAPGVVQYSLGVQQELQPSLILVVQYVGNLAWHQQVERNINTYSLNTPLTSTQAALGSVHTPGRADNSLYSRANAGDPNNKSGTNPGASSIPVPDQLRNFVGYTGITQQENSTNGGYNGFQTGLRAQNKHGLTGEIDYTWSHEIDITSFDEATVSNPFNLKYDKGSGAIDRRNILSINYVYKLPFFTSPNTFAHSIAGGWEVAGTFIAETGVIIQNQGPGLSVGYDPVGLGGGYSNRPNVNGKVHYTKKSTQWFDPSVFSAPIPVWAGGVNQGFGNARKDTVLGPGRNNFTTSLYKTFVIHEGIEFKFRAESFNTFNHTQFNGVSNNYGNGNFGAITSTYDPRVLELGASLKF